MTTTDQKIDGLTRVVESGFAAMAEDITVIKESMATRNELAQMRGEMAGKDQVRIIVHDEMVPARTELRDIRHQLAGINQRLEDLDSAIGDIRGYAKEIDYLNARMRDIEKHLGITHHIAA